MSTDDHVRYRVAVLGQLSVEGPDGPLDPGGRKPRLLLALLVAEAGSVVPTDRLIDGLWGEDPPATARKTLHVHVSNLRRSLGPGFPLETARAGYRVDAASVAIDAVRFEDDVRRAATLRDSAPVDASAVLAAALARWTGPAYADLTDEEAIRPEIIRLDELRLSAVEQRIDADLRLGRHEQVLGELDALTTDHPYRERLRALHMVALYRAGRQTDALRAYDRTRRILAEDLGIDPGPELRELQRKVLEQSADLALEVRVASTVTVGSGQPSAAPDVAGSGPSGVGWSVRGYELRERLGERGGSVVHRAYQASVGREVALKIMPPEVANEPGFVMRFEADCRLLAELEHPHIVGLYDYWRDPGGAYIVMPLLRGGTLERSLERSSWRPAAALQLLDQVGSALSHAHRRGVIHGDLRPSNVLLDDDGNAYLADFALDGPSSWERELPVGPDGARPDQPAVPTATPAADVHGLADLTCRVLTGVGPAEAPFTPVDLPAGFDDVIRRATDPDPLRRYERVEDFLRALRQTFGTDVVSPGRSRAPSPVRNPYKGLRAFGETDAMDYFGRDDLLAELVARVSAGNLTAVVGPSGSGKSSLVKAGLVPAVRRGALATGRDVVIAEMFPGSYPFEELESALLRVAVDRPDDLLADLAADERGLMRVSKQILPGDDTDLLLIIDQFEELFALTADESVRSNFLASLVTVATDERSRVRVVVTLRADFYDRPLQYPDFGELVKRSLTTVTLPGDPSLAEAIAEPARRVGLEVEPGLIPTILRDVAGEPGALPLLQYALTELVDGADGDVLTIAGYARTGGVVGALATRAEEIYSGLSPSGREAAREVFVRLVTVSDDADDTRRRVRRTELEALGIDSQVLETVIGAFGSFRLLSFDRDPVTRGPTVEVAHEALIREWPRYRRWIDERRDDLRTERRLEAAVAEWRAGDRDPTFLIAGGRLERYERWAGASDVRLTDDERRFLDESRGRERERAETIAKRRRRVLASVSALAVVALVAAVVAIVQRDRAADQAQAARAQSAAATEAAAEAEELRLEAQREALHDESSALMARAAEADDPDLRLGLALAAHDALEAEGLEDPSVTSALYQFTYHQPIEARVTGPDILSDIGAPVHSSPDGSKFVVTTDHDASTIDARTGATIGTLEVPGLGAPNPGHRRDLIGSVWEPSTGLILTGRENGTIELWESTGERVDSIRLPTARSVWPLFARDELLGVGRFGVSLVGLFEVVVLDRSTGDIVLETEQVVREAALSPSGAHLAIAELDTGARLLDTTTWDDVTPDELRADVRGAVADDVEWSSTGQLWILEDNTVTKVAIATGDELATIDTGLARSRFIAESRDGSLLVVGGNDEPVRVFDTSTGDLVIETVESSTWELPQIVRPGFSVAWAADRRLVLTERSETTIWDLGTPNAAAVLWAGSDAPVVSGATRAGGTVVAFGDGGVEVFDPADRSEHSVVGVGRSDVPAVLGGDGATLAVPAAGGVDLLDVATGEVRASGPSGLPRPLALSDDGSLLVAGSARDPDDGQHLVAIVDAETGDPLHRLGSLIDGERAAFTSDGGLAVIPVSPVVRREDSAGTSGLWVVDTATGEILVKGPPEACITAVAVSSDDTAAATVGCDGAVSLYDLETLVESDEPWTARLGGDTDDRTPGVGVTFGPDDESVIVTRQDGRVEMYQADADFDRMWSFDVGDHVGMPDVRDGMVWVGVTSPFVAPEIASGGVIAMPLDRDELVDFARASVTRELTDAECEEYVGRPSCAGD